MQNQKWLRVPEEYITTLFTPFHQIIEADKLPLKAAFQEEHKEVKPACVTWL